MDRRSLLAIVLIFGLTLVWSRVSRQFYGNPPVEDSVDSLEVRMPPLIPGGSETPTDTRETTSHEPGRSRPQTIPGLDAGTHRDIESDNPSLGFKHTEPRVITVETDLYRAEYTTHGAIPVSWRLLEYPGIDQPAVELIPARDEFSVPPSADVLVFSRGNLATANIDFDPVGRLDIDAVSTARDLVFIAETNNGVVLKKTLSFRPGHYAHSIRYDLSFTSSEARTAFLAEFGEPVSTSFIWDRGIAVTEHSASRMVKRMQTERSFAMVGEEIQFRLQKDLGKSAEKAGGVFRGSLRFAGLQNKYFVIIGFIPGAETDPTGAPANIVEGRIRLGGNSETMNQSWEVELPLRDSSGVMSTTMSYYMGPSEYNRLRDYGSSLEKTVNLGWKWIEWLSEFMLALLNWLHRYIPNYGWVIVAVSILSKLVFYPLTARGTRSMKKMQESQTRLKPKMDALKSKCGKDSQRYNQELMTLYREEGVNPVAGMAGCLPMLIQMPVFIALYQVLYNMVDLRQTPFIFWINDLSQPDALFLLPFSLPLLGSSFNLLPIIMAIATWAQTKLTPQTGGAGGQMAAMNNIMPVMMMFFLYNMPSGLVIYWTINTAMTAFQSWTVNRSASAEAGVQV